MNSRASFELHTLGRLGLRVRGGPELASLLSQPKRVALLCYLALAEGFVRRDLLLPLFWPESDDAHARASLRQAIHFLRHSLGERTLISRGDEEIRIDHGALWYDVVAFEQAVAARRDEDACALYRGEFLPGFFVAAAPEFDQWLDSRRERLRRAAVDSAWALAEKRERAAEVTRAVECGRRALALAPTDEASLRRFMLLLERSGDRSGAIEAYERYVRRMRTEYESEPAPEASELAKEMARRRTAACSSSASGSEAVTAGSGVLTSRSGRWRNWAQIALPAVLLINGAFYLSLRATSPPFDARKEIVVADFANHTRDANLAAGVTQALTIDLAQSHHIRLASAQRVAGVLERMAHADRRALTPELAREVAVREGLQAVLQGDVAELGSGYAVTAQLVTADSGRVLLSYREEAQKPGDVLRAVDRLSAKLRRHSGESLRDAHAQQPLAAVTTSSLEALKAYSAAARVQRQSLWQKREDPRSSNADVALRLLERAIALDTTFAAAYRSYGVALYWMGQRARASEMLTHAFQLRERLAERERLLTEGTYYSFVRDDYDSAIARFEQLLQMDPTDDAALQHLLNLNLQRKDYTRAAQYADREWAVHGGAPTNQYVIAMLGAGRIARADSFLQYHAARETVAGVWQTQLIRLEQTRGHYHAVDTLFDRLQVLMSRSAPAARILPTRLLGSWKIWRGAYAEGAALLRASFPQEGATSRLELAFNLARYDVFVLHDAPAARRRLDAALRANPLAGIAPADRPYLNIAQAYAFAGDYARADALRREFEAVKAPLKTDNYKLAALYNVGALVAAARGDVARARQIMAEGEREIGCWQTAPWLRLGRAVMEELTADPDSVIAAWQRFVATPSCLVVTSYDGAYASAMALAHAHERLAMLYDARGDVQTAAAHYREFIETWSTPDPELQPRWNTARRRLEQLSVR